ncbi:MAG: sigma-70 family RNA polymerase sigma factor [Planctomycetes bacterium]|nr:sigma-70 family RNA polymerase sigma factor [Planctomycetota bacterium]
MTKEQARSEKASWPPRDSLEYVQSQGFLQLLTDTAMDMTSIEEIGGAFALVLDWMERKCSSDAEYLKQFLTEEHLKRYLRTALKNKAIDVARRWSQSLPLVPLVDTTLVAHSLSPLEQVSNDELIERVGKAMESLTPIQQQLVKNIIINGLSFRETALMLGISVSAAHGHFKMAISELANRI